MERRGQRVVRGSISDKSTSLNEDLVLSLAFRSLHMNRGVQHPLPTMVRQTIHLQAIYSSLLTLPVSMRPRTQRVIDTLTLVTEYSFLMEEKNPSRANLLAE